MEHKKLFDKLVTKIKESDYSGMTSEDARYGCLYPLHNVNIDGFCVKFGKIPGNNDLGYSHTFHIMEVYDAQGKRLHRFDHFSASDDGAYIESALSQLSEEARKRAAQAGTAKKENEKRALREQLGKLEAVLS